MSGFTPGPWKYRKARCHFYVEASAGGFGSSRVVEVRFAENSTTGWTSEANARLIAAAPDLAEALAGLLEEADTWKDDAVCDHEVNICWCDYYRRIDAARAALAKAGVKP